MSTLLVDSERVEFLLYGQHTSQRPRRIAYIYALFH